MRSGGNWLLGVIIACALTGCADRDFPARDTAAAAEPAITVAPDVLHTAADKTLAGARAEVSVSVTVTGLGTYGDLPEGSFNLAGTGTTNFGSNATALTVSLPFVDRLTGGGAPVEERIVDGVVYLRLPPSLLRSAGVPDPVSWVSLDAVTQAGPDVTAMSQSLADPVRQVEYLAAAVGRPVVVGRADVRGDDTTHYRADIDVSSMSLADRIGDTPLQLEAWIDGDGLARRVVVTFPVSRLLADLATIPDEAIVTVQQDFFAFGTKAHIRRPPADEVAPYEALGLGTSQG